MAVSDVLIRSRGVAFAYEPGRPVLEGLDFELRRGERVGLTGANGSGKTTFLHLAVGLLHPTAGEIEAFGQVRRHEADFVEVRQRAGLLFQDPEDQLFCPTVAEDVAFGPLNLGKTRDQAVAAVAETLESLGLEGYEDRVTYKLSGGEKRLVSLATILAMKPEVLLLDEPTSGLDEHSEKRLLDILTSLSLTMVVASHNREFLKSTTNKALLLKNGRLEPCDLDRLAARDVGAALPA